MPTRFSKFLTGSEEDVARPETDSNVGIGEQAHGRVPGKTSAMHGDAVAVSADGPDGEDLDEFSVGAAPDEDDDVSVGTAEVQAEDQERDAFEVVDCRFDRIGDTNGVFYYLGRRHVVS